ncbi:DUF1972 domain-containing protein [Kordiimonas sp.]|uniref:DUF1972 domain-containing protein n=1 Tax=Kordiimonas sp. TaxID=1970157 RepID=UPI003A8CDCF5
MSEGRKTAIIGTVGVPGKYGGFETLAENLVRYGSSRSEQATSLTVYCSAKAYPERSEHHLDADLVYLPLNANGIQSIPYDILSMLSAIRRGHDNLLILGVSGCLALPFFRLLTKARIITNIDGLEWRRNKWRGLAKWILRFSEKLAVRYSDIVIADNQAIADYVSETYGRSSEVIAYGGDHALADDPTDISVLDLPDAYALALCRIEPENNIDMILEAFAKAHGNTLVFVGNWEASAHGLELRQRFRSHPNMHLLDPVYDAGRLRAIRDRATLYVHGHSAGGTNPSLVEMMQFGVPVLAFDCSYNRYTTEDQARYFNNAQCLADLLDNPCHARESSAEGAAMREIARRRYSWDRIGAAYFALFDREW